MSSRKTIDNRLNDRVFSPAGERDDYLDPEDRRELVRGAHRGRSYRLLPRVLRAGRSAITLRGRRASRSQRACIFVH